MVKKYILIFSLALAALLKCDLSSAQSCSTCEAALKNGTTDVFQSEKHQALDESVYTLYNYDFEFWESYNTTSNKSASLSAAYSIFSAAFGSISNSTERKETFKRQKSAFQYSHSIAQSDYEKISRILINKTPYQTFQKCVQDLCGNGIFIESATSGDEIIITVRLVVTQGPPTQTSLTTIPSIANATPIDFNFHKGVILKSNSSISAVYRRNNPKQSSVFSFDFANYHLDPYTVKRAEYANTSLPVGSIVISELDYSTFCSVNDITSTGDISDIIWVPADGRDVKGSVYGGKIANVPDLRGVFLRGLNVFDAMNNPRSRRPEQLDPQNRNVDDLQPQSLQKHVHDINDPGHNHLLAKGTTTDSWGGRVVPSGQGDQGCDHCAERIATFDKQKTGITVLDNKDAGPETRPTNVAVYYYIKIN